MNATEQLKILEIAFMAQCAVAGLNPNTLYARINRLDASVLDKLEGRSEIEQSLLLLEILIMAPEPIILGALTMSLWKLGAPEKALVMAHDAVLEANVVLEKLRNSDASGLADLMGQMLAAEMRG